MSDNFPHIPGQTDRYLELVIELIQKQNQLLEDQNLLLRTFVEAMVREEEDAVPMQQLKDLLEQQRTGAANISTMDGHEEPAQEETG